MDFTTNGTLGKNSTVTNGYTGEVLSVAGKRGSTGIFTASGGDTTLYGDTFAANLNDAFIYDFTIGGTNALRFSGITEFNLGAGDDLLDLTVRPANAASAYTTNVTAYGGVGDDVIWGGDGRDTLYGDVSALSGQGGDDVVRGGGSSNTLYGDAYTIIEDGQGGDDQLSADGAPSRTTGEDMYGDAYSILAGGSGGDDMIYGASGNDLMKGDAYSLYGTGGNDQIWGYDGPDEMYGDAVYIYDGGVGGDDTLWGGDGRDTLRGDAVYLNTGSTAGDDELHGGAGNDTLYGEGDYLRTSVTGGNDILAGGAGNDALYGEAKTRDSGSIGGNDTFVFAPDGGVDTIHDFGFGDDVIDVTAWGFTGIDNLTIENNASASVTVRFDADNYVTVNHHAGQNLTLTADDFVFTAPLP